MACFSCLSRTGQSNPACQQNFFISSVATLLAQLVRSYPHLGEGIQERMEPLVMSDPTSSMQTYVT
jgi:hypothetical protein